jgi:hypothetical protein
MTILGAVAIETHLPRNNLPTNSKEPFIMTIQALTDMVSIIKSHDDDERLTGDTSAESVAQEWLDAGFLYEDAEAYIAAGAWDAQRAGQLFRAGIMASDLNVAQASAHSNGDISTEEIFAAVKAFKAVKTTK